MNKILCAIFILAPIGFFLFLFWDEAFITIFNWVRIIIQYAKSIQDAIGWFATVFSIVMYVKLRFFDTRLFNKLMGAYGKQKFMEALKIILEMLEVMNPEDIIKKTSLISQVEIEMRKSVKELNHLLDDKRKLNANGTIQLNRQERKLISGQIKILMSLIDKRLEMHFISKDAKETLLDLSSTIKRGIKTKKKLAPFDEKQSQDGRNRVITNFGDKPCDT